MIALHVEALCSSILASASKALTKQQKTNLFCPHIINCSMLNFSPWVWGTFLDVLRERSVWQNAVSGVVVGVGAASSVPNDRGRSSSPGSDGHWVCVFGLKLACTWRLGSIDGEIISEICLNSSLHCCVLPS